MSERVISSDAHGRLSGLLDAIGDAVFALDAQERFLFANRKALELWAKTAEELSGRVILDVFPEIRNSETYRVYRQVLETGNTTHTETRAFALGERWIELDAYPTPQGGLVVAFRDIDDRKRAEEALRESEERFRTMLEALPHIAFVIHGGGVAEFYNAMFREYVGAPIGKDPISRLSLHHPEDQEGLAQARELGRSEDREYTVEARIRRHDGQYRWHRIHNRPLRRGDEVVAWLGTAVDIDEMRRANELLERRIADRTAALQAANNALTTEIEQHKRTEQGLKESEERHRKLYNRTPMALQSVDADARLIDVNDYWLQLFGFSREQVIGRSPAEFMTEDSSRRYRERAWPEMLDSHGAVRTVEYEFKKKNGDVFHGRLSACGEFDNSGGFVRSWSAIANITAEKQAEAQLLRAQRLDAVGQLTSGVAHDFNNLLTAIIGNLEMLGAGGLPNSRSERFLTAAQDAAVRGSRLTSQLLAFSRKQRMAPEPADLNQVIDSMGPLLQSTMGTAVRITTCLDRGLWPALVDVSQIELVLLNLVINARDATPLAGLITIETANVTLESPTRWEEPPAGDYVMVAVSDSGTGITPEVLTRVFEPFFTTKEVGKGSGLGLPQVLGVAQQLGGGIRIETERDVGTVVKVYLPRSRITPVELSRASTTASKVADTHPSVAGTILLVDDDPDVRDVMATFLRDQYHEVIEASSGSAALATLRREQHRIDLLIVDFAMPGMNGMELARLAKQLVPGLLILVVTGFAETANLGVDDAPLEILSKPFRGADLNTKVSKMLLEKKRSSAVAP